jgi:hypothetical protein
MICSYFKSKKEEEKKNIKNVVLLCVMGDGMGGRSVKILFIVPVGLYGTYRKRMDCQLKLFSYQNSIFRNSILSKALPCKYRLPSLLNN